MSLHRLLTTAEVAELLHCSPDKVERLRDLVRIRLGKRCVRFRMEDVEAFIASCATVERGPRSKRGPRRTREGR